MSAMVDRTGQRFGRLVVLDRSDRSTYGRVFWRCRCDCGAITHAPGSSLKSGDTKSCGCYFLEVAAKKGRAKVTHGMTGTPAYRSWVGMRQRCENPRNPKFALYGGRGIAVCDRWQSFEAFISDMGDPPPGASIDRVNVDGNYEPGNCRWASQVEQQNNRRDNVLIHLDGTPKTMAQYARDHGLSADKIQWRLKHGWPVERACQP